MQGFSRAVRRPRFPTRPNPCTPLLPRKAALYRVVLPLSPACPSAPSFCFAHRASALASTQAFLEVETEFLSIANTEGLSDGTTALAAVIQDGTSMTIAHVGDSRGVLCRDGEAVVVTHDHKPELEEERRRIEAAGGFVSYIGCWRAMGILAMSRAIGDIFLKPYVSAIPDVRVVQLGDRDEFVVLASDGVYDVFDNDEVVTIARGATDPQQAANVLTNSAFAAGSLDNLTAVVIALNGYSPKPRAALSVVEAAQTFHASAPSSGANPASWLTPPARFGVASNWRYNTWLDLAGF